MKLEKLRHIFKGRGRKLKCEKNPDLAGILEFAFGESDCEDRAGRGLESHSRLTDTVLYQTADSNTIMKHARETILALAPEGFKISLLAASIIPRIIVRERTKLEDTIQVEVLTPSCLCTNHHGLGLSNLL